MEILWIRMWPWRSEQVQGIAESWDASFSLLAFLSIGSLSESRKASSGQKMVANFWSVFNKNYTHFEIRYRHKTSNIISYTFQHVHWGPSQMSFCIYLGEYSSAINYHENFHRSTIDNCGECSGYCCAFGCSIAGWMWCFSHHYCWSINIISSS